MSPAVETEETKEVEFKWGKRRDYGWENNGVQFYESFTYDGDKYALYDCVYLAQEGGEPHIGKLIDIWENADKSKKVKVQWFLRPSDIVSSHLEDMEFKENEIFLAAGKGKGLANINYLDTLSGRCNVICISTDVRNPQPSPEELQRAEFVFYRTFDVNSFQISDQIGDSVGGLPAKFVFNRKEENKSLDIPTLGLNKKDGRINGPLKDSILSERSNALRERSLKTSDIAPPLSEAAGYENKSAGTRKSEKSDLGSFDSKERLRRKVHFEDPARLLKSKNDKAVQKLNNKTLEAKEKNWQTAPTSKEDEMSPRLRKRSMGLDKGPLKEYGSEKRSKDSSGSYSKSLAMASRNEGKRAEGQFFEVTRKPVVEKSKWLTELPWEDRMQPAQDEGRLVLLQNLDPEYTSEEVEDIIWNAFKETCSAKLLQHTAVSCPHSGQAFILLKTKEAAMRLLKKLCDRCLILPNKRVLVGCAGILPTLSSKQKTIVRHLGLDNVKLSGLLQRDTKDALTTAHFSQNNSVEHEMAMEWLVSQSRSDAWWKMLYERQWKELKELGDNLKCDL